MAEIRWTPARRVAIRFATVYVLLYSFPVIKDLTPAGRLFLWWNRIWVAVIKWAGLHIFGVTITVLPNGSGDTTFNYVEVFCLLLIAALATAVWSAVDRRVSYDALWHALRSYVRFFLAAVMLIYGAAKVIPVQFPAPSLDRLIQPIGDASPMGLLWTFMGASAPYTIFAGLGEVIAGLLLTMRRTASLGALITIAVMSNVAMLNFSYDVPVKLFSIHLLVLAAFVLLPDAGRLTNVLILNRPAPAVELRPQLNGRWVPIIRTLVVLAFFAFAFLQARTIRKVYAAHSPFYGIWNVDEFSIDGQPRPPLTTDRARWRRVVFDSPQVFSVELMNDARERFRLKLDQAKKTMTVSGLANPQAKSTVFVYSIPAPDFMSLEGRLEGKEIRARLHREPASAFLLTTRGFHWINEYPFNR